MKTEKIRNKKQILLGKYFTCKLKCEIHRFLIKMK